MVWTAVCCIPYIYDKPEDARRATRGFFVVSGTLADEHVTIIVNHLPSRGATSYYRELGGKQIRAVKDSLLKDDPNVKLFIMGDMNDDPADPSMSKALGAQRELEDVKPGGLFNPAEPKGQEGLFFTEVLEGSDIPSRLSLPARRPLQGQHPSYPCRWRMAQWL